VVRVHRGPPPVGKQRFHLSCPLDIGRPRASRRPTPRHGRLVSIHTMRTGEASPGLTGVGGRGGEARVEIHR